MRILCVALSLLTLAGCEGLLDGADGGEPRPVDAEVPPAEVAGRWLITGSGQMRGCDDARFDTDDLQLQSAPLSVVQTDDTLSVPNPPQPATGTFAFREGRVSGVEIRFKTIEQGPDLGVALTYRGRLDDLGRIVGTFTGEGPGTCESSGDFLIEIE